MKWWFKGMVEVLFPRYRDYCFYLVDLDFVSCCWTLWLLYLIREGGVGMTEGEDKR